MMSPVNQPAWQGTLWQGSTSAPARSKDHTALACAQPDTQDILLISSSCLFFGSRITPIQIFGMSSHRSYYPERSVDVQAIL